MDPSAIVASIEEAPHHALSLLRRHRETPGLSRAFAARVVELFGTDTGKAIALGRHWRSLLKYGDEPALAYRVRGIYERLEGRWVASAEAFIEAGNHATNAVEALSFQVGAVDSFARGGRMDQALELGSRLAIGLDGLKEHALAARVRLNLGNALSWQDRMDEARAFLAPAIQPLANAGFLVESSSARMALSTTHIFGGRLREAGEHANDAMVQARALGFEYLADLCEINIAHVELLSGRPETALDRLLTLRSRFEDSPVDVTRTLEFLGDAYYRLNLWPEAADAYEEALRRPSTIIALHRAHLHLGIGQARLAEGNVQEATKELRRARYLYLRLGNPAWASAAITSLSEASFADGDRKAAAKLANEAIRLAEESGARYHLAEALLASCAASPDERRLSQAVSLIRREGYRGLSWKVLRLQAQAAPRGKKLGFYRRMFEAIHLGRLQVSSISSRSTYLKDKSEAIQEYLAELLASPTARSAAEAVHVIEQTRSVTLLDELLLARSQSLSPESLRRLNDLREELRTLGGEDQPSGPARRAVSASLPMASIQRRWLDVTRNVRAEVEAFLPPQSATGVIFVETKHAIFALTEGRLIRLAVTTETLTRTLKWLQFELLAPLADRDADSSEADRIFGDLAQSLVAPWLEQSEPAICPDGLLWRVPWSVCVAMLDDAKSAELRLHPSLGGHSHRKLTMSGRPVLWCSNAPDLPHAAAESRAFLDRFPDAKVCTTAAQARESMEGEIPLLHVVAHAKHRASNPMFSAVIFNDGPVLANEIARSAMRPSLVTLSACETGAMSLISREEPDGLARAFLARGASNVVASMWPLDDEAAGVMYGSFFEALDAGASIAESVANARRSARAWRRHPYFWGSLTMYGGYAQ